jgi:ABC-type ATPase with predicted acetyltransferase domain
MKYEVILESPINNNFRCKLACDSLDIDINKKSKHHLVINADIPKDFNIGIILGASGSGKTTLAKKIYGNDIFESPLNQEEPIINQLPKEFNYEECASILSGIGLNSVPCWVRPVKTLSNGQKARAEAALLMSSEKEIIAIDEWTSVVDRNVAKAMSFTLQKYARKKNKRIVLCSCHYDVIEWLNPDWVIDCNKQEFIKKKNEAFF